MRKLFIPLCLLTASIFADSVYAESPAQFVHQSAKRVQTEVARTPSRGDNGVEVGYIQAGDYIYPYDGMAVNQDLRVGVCVRIPKEKIAGYAGAKITNLRVGWSELAEKPEVDFFLTEELNGEVKASGKATVAFDWNTLTFDTPYTIPTDVKDVYIGYYVDLKAGKFCIPESVYGTRYEKSHYTCRLDEDVDGKHTWYDMSKDCGVFFINAVVLAEGDEFQNIMIPIEVRQQEISLKDEFTTCRLTVTNQGMNNVSRFKLQYECGDKTGEYLCDFKTREILPGQTITAYAPILGLGSGVNKLRITEVQDKENKQKDVALEYDLLVVDKATAEAHPHRPVVELWIGENNHVSPMYTDQLFYPGLQKNDYYKKMSVITRHVEDQYSMGEDEERTLNIDLFGGDINAAGYPAMATNRAYYPTNMVAEKRGPLHGVLYPDYSFYAYDPALATPAFASVNVTPVYNKDGNKLVVKAEGDIVGGILPEGENLYLSVYVLEDNVKSANQEFPDDGGETIANYPDGIFTHHNLIRWQCSGIYGDMINGSGNFSKDYTVELDPEWKLGDLKVVAMLNRGVNLNPFKMQIINSCEASATGGSFIADLDQDMPVVYVENGQLIVKGDYDSVRVFDVAGVELSPANIGRGLCFVEIVRNGVRNVSKILVK